MTWNDVFNENTLWIAIAALAPFVIACVLGRLLIPLLRKLKAGQMIREVGPSWHQTKQGTPMMGGLIFIGAVCVVFAATCWHYSGAELWSALCVLFMGLACAVIGFLDDLEKMLKKRNLGLTVVQKLVLQFAVAITFLIVADRLDILNGGFYIPIADVFWQPHWAIYYAISAVVIVLIINAANLTDGIDGLAAGVSTPICIYFAVSAAILAYSFDAVAALALSLAGALLGFLTFNYNPASVFMGDTGSLFIGGMVAGFAYVTNQPVILIPVCFVYLLEAASVVLQVGYFKLTHGKRLFKMAPFHHHLELCGWKEKKIFWFFTILTLALCAAAYFISRGALSDALNSAFH